MKAENARQVQGLIELEKFNPETLCSGESWMAPSASEVSVVRAALLQIVGGDKLIIPFC